MSHCHLSVLIRLPCLENGLDLLDSTRHASIMNVPVTVHGYPVVVATLPLCSHHEALSPGPPLWVHLKSDIPANEPAIV